MVLFVRIGGAQVETAGVIAREYSLYRKTDGFLHIFHNTKREYSFSVYPMVVLPFFSCL